MANLVSPGVQVQVIDESFYASSGPGTVPFIMMATAAMEPQTQSIQMSTQLGHRFRSSEIPDHSRELIIPLLVGLRPLTDQEHFIIILFKYQRPPET